MNLKQNIYIQNELTFNSKENSSNNNNKQQTTTTTKAIA